MGVRTTNPHVQLHTDSNYADHTRKITTENMRQIDAAGATEPRNTRDGPACGCGCGLGVGTTAMDAHYSLSASGSDCEVLQGIHRALWQERQAEREKKAEMR